jgi:hypothetical protein
MAVTTCRHTGSFKISGMIGGYLETRVYMGYLLCEAITSWNLEFNRHG